MKKAVILGTLLSLTLLVGTVFAAPKQEAAAPKVAPAPVSGTVAAPAPAKKSPWSASAFLRTERVATGKYQTGLSNLMFLEVGRSILENQVSDLKLALRLYGENKFKSDATRSGLDSNYRWIGPVLLLTKGKLFDVGGVVATAQTRAYLPVDSEARLSKRNPNSGVWRQVLAFEKSVGRWTFGNENFVQYYDYKRDSFEGKPNNLFRLYNDLVAAYKVSDGVVLKSALELERRWKRVAKENTSLMEWANTVEFSPVKNLTVETGVVLSAKNQALHNYFESNQTRLDNTTARLDLSYKFL